MSAATCVARLLHGAVRLLAEGVLAAGRVAVALREVRQHLLQHRGVDRRRGVVVEVDARPSITGFFHTRPGVWCDHNRRPGRRRIVLPGMGRETPRRRGRDDDESPGRRPAAVARWAPLRAPRHGARRRPRRRVGRRRGPDEAAQPDTRRPLRVLENPYDISSFYRSSDGLVFGPDGGASERYPIAGLLPPARRVGPVRLLAVLDQRLLRPGDTAAAARGWASASAARSARTATCSCSRPRSSAPVGPLTGVFFDGITLR